MKYSLLIIAVVLFFSCDNSNNSEKKEFSKEDIIILKEIADNYKHPSLKIGDPEKYVWPKVIARMSLYGSNDSLSLFYLDSLGNNPPFHFTLVGMARIMNLFPGSPYFKENKSMVIRKVFERDDSFNAWTAEGTENHVNMSRTSGYLFAEAALEFPDKFPDAKEKVSKMKKWLKWYSKTIYKQGTAEWNSSIYTAYNYIGWLNLYDFAKDKEVKFMAKAVLDYYAAEQALSYYKGLIFGSEMRGGGAIANTGRSATAIISKYWFTDDILKGFKGHSQSIQLVYAVTSNYKPDEAILNLSQNRDYPSLYKGCKTSYNFSEPCFIKQRYFFDDGYALSSATDNYGGFYGSSYQIVNWKLFTNSEKGDIIKIGGNGYYHKKLNGKTRDPFTQIGQYKNVLFQLTKVPGACDEITKRVIDSANLWERKYKEDLFKRFPSEKYRRNHRVVSYNKNSSCKNKSYISSGGGDIIKKHNYYYIESEEANVLIFPVNSLKDSLFSNEKMNTLIIEQDKGEVCGFIVEVLSKDNYNLPDSLSYSFENDIISYKPLSSDKELGFEFVEEGRYIEPMVDWGYGPEEPLTKSLSPPFNQPDWKYGEYNGRVGRFYLNGEHLEPDTGFVFKGPGYNLENSIMEVNAGNYSLKIDYSGEVPTFN